MREEVAAQVGQDALADPARQVRLRARQANADDADQHYATGDKGEQARVAGDDRRVDRGLHQEWQRECAGQHAKHRGNRADQTPPVRTGIRAEPRQPLQALLAEALARDDDAADAGWAATHEPSSWSIPTGIITWSPSASTKRRSTRPWSWISR